MQTVTSRACMHAMALKSNHALLFLLLAVSAALVAVLAGEPADIPTDTAMPPDMNDTSTDGGGFTYTCWRRALTTRPPPGNVTVVQPTAAEFPALNGQGVPYSMLAYPAGSVNAAHNHPGSPEVLLLLRGSLSVGFVDTANKLRTKKLVAGDMFVFPKGLVHYQLNRAQAPAVALAAYGSAALASLSIADAVSNIGNTLANTMGDIGGGVS